MSQILCSITTVFHRHANVHAMVTFHAQIAYIGVHCAVAISTQR
ncbi:MAG: hypothetical protein ACOZBL_02190 [Patescibacteria group bacterium]